MQDIALLDFKWNMISALIDLQYKQNAIFKCDTTDTNIFNHKIWNKDITLHKHCQTAIYKRRCWPNRLSASYNSSSLFCLEASVNLCFWKKIIIIKYDIQQPFCLWNSWQDAMTPPERKRKCQSWSSWHNWAFSRWDEPSTWHGTQEVCPSAPLGCPTMIRIFKQKNFLAD